MESALLLGELQEGPGCGAGCCAVGGPGGGRRTQRDPQPQPSRRPVIWCLLVFRVVSFSYLLGCENSNMYPNGACFGELSCHPRLHWNQAPAKHCVASLASVCSG